MKKTLERFFDASDTLLLTVRERRVPEEEAFALVVQNLEELTDIYRDAQSLPKELVGVLLEMSTAMYSAADAHDEPARSALYRQFDVVADKIRDLCN